MQKHETPDSIRLGILLIKEQPTNNKDSRKVGGIAMKKYETARYDELKEGDLIMFYGALERVTKVDSFPNEKTIRFEIEPVNEESIKILGEFYSRGRYGGVGCITVTKVQFIND